MRAEGENGNKRTVYLAGSFVVLLTTLLLAADHQGRQASSRTRKLLLQNFFNKFFIERGHEKLSVGNLGKLFSVALGMCF